MPKYVKAPPRSKKGKSKGVQAAEKIVRDLAPPRMLKVEPVSLEAPIRARAQAAMEAREGLKNLVSKCRAYTSAAVDTLVQVMQTSGHAPSRVAAAKTLIEFGHGKAPETVRLEKLYSPEEMKLLAEAIVLRRAREGIVDGGVLGTVDEPKKL